jgi:hypothetical protein
VFVSNSNEQIITDGNDATSVGYIFGNSSQIRFISTHLDDDYTIRSWFELDELMMLFNFSLSESRRKDNNSNFEFINPTLGCFPRSFFLDFIFSSSIKCESIIFLPRILGVENMKIQFPKLEEYKIIKKKNVLLHRSIIKQGQSKVQ